MGPVCNILPITLSILWGPFTKFSISIRIGRTWGPVPFNSWSPLLTASERGENSKRQQMVFERIKQGIFIFISFKIKKKMGH